MKSLVKAFRIHAERLLQNIGSLDSPLVQVEHLQDRRESRFLFDEIAYERSLEISKRNLIGRPGPGECPFHTADSYEAPAIKRFDQVDAPSLAPAGPGSALFINRQSLRKPPRDPIVGHLQRDDVGEFVPQGAAPVEVALFPCRWAVHRYHLTEADSQRAQPRQAQRSNSEVLMVGEDLDHYRTLRRKVVLL